MLSIGKLAAGQERYYEQQVASGLDDYYTGRGESPGRWLGRAATTLGLVGTVEDGELGRLMQGRHPRTGQLLRERDVDVAALDLTFSAPKSVSVLFAVGSEEVQRELVGCHEQAAEAALGYMEETAAFVRRGKGGASFEHAGGLVVAAFRHRMSRALDPQLHTHCVAANMAQGQDGRWTALHHPSLYRMALTAGYLYQAHLRALVHERLGSEWRPVRKGMAELADVPSPVLEEFSRRRHEMRRALEAGGLGLDTKSRAQAVALATRERKQYGVETHTWQEEVRARAREHGLDLDTCRRIVERGRRRTGRAPDRAAAEQELRDLLDALAAEHGLTEKQNTFAEPDVLRALAEAEAQGATVDVLRARAAQFAARVDVLRTRTGELTTSELVGIERRLIAAAQGRASEGVGRVDSDTLEHALAVCERGLNRGQEHALRATVTSGHGVQVIEALAGTGKTYMAGVLRYVYERAGYEVVGVAPTGRAVRELAQEAGIPSRTLASMTSSLREGAQVPENAVVIFDEAGMAGTRETAVLLEAAQAAGAKVVAIGDAGQLRSVQAGGWMRAVGRKVGTLKLSDVMRQRDPDERRALGLLHEGRPRGWLEWAFAGERVRVGAEREQLELAVGEWRKAVEEHGLSRAVLIARSNETRRALNERARELLRHEDRLGDEWRYGPVTLAVGDRVICRRNDREVDVDNGTRGTVKSLAAQGAVIETDGGVVRELPAAYLAEHVELAYALTGHGMQGGTVEWAGVVAVPHELTRGWSYTALSRARGTTRLFVVSEGEGWHHHEEQRRDEIAPGERQEKLTTKELLEQVARYMQTRDDEDLAVEQLPVVVGTGRANDPVLENATTSLQERGADVIDAVGGEGTVTVASFVASRDRVEALRAQLEALSTRDVKRLEAAERQELDLLSREEQLAGRAASLPSPPRMRRDPHFVERTNLGRELAGVQAQLDGVRSLLSQLEREVGSLAEIRGERSGLESALAAAEGERDQLRSELVARQVADPPAWAREALGDPPADGRLRRHWERAVREVAGYRLDHDIDREDTLLGDPPGDPSARRVYDHVAALIGRVQRELEQGRVERGQPDTLAARVRAVLGEERGVVLDEALHRVRHEVRAFDGDQLNVAVSDGRTALDALDRVAAAQTLRLERERVEHERCVREQEERVAGLERQAASRGWRQRHERRVLEDAVDAQRPHIDRHLADVDRIELELDRLRSTGRHPDLWVREHLDRAALGLAAGEELAAWRERSIAEQAARARIDPPDYVRELIGPPPVSGVAFAKRWEELAERLERHRLEYGIDVDRDGPLGSSPGRVSAKDRNRYEQSRELLAGEVERLRADRGMPDDPPVREIVESVHERSVGLGREL